jgi:hypothetical protein
MDVAPFATVPATPVRDVLDASAVVVEPADVEATVLLEASDRLVVAVVLVVAVPSVGGVVAALDVELRVTGSVDGSAGSVVSGAGTLPSEVGLGDDGRLLGVPVSGCSVDGSWLVGGSLVAGSEEVDGSESGTDGSVVAVPGSLEPGSVVVAAGSVAEGSLDAAPSVAAPSVAPAPPAEDSTVPTPSVPVSANASWVPPNSSAALNPKTRTGRMADRRRERPVSDMTVSDRAGVTGMRIRLPPNRTGCSPARPSVQQPPAARRGARPPTHPECSGRSFRLDGPRHQRNPRGVSVTPVHPIDESRSRRWLYSECSRAPRDSVVHRPKGPRTVALVFAERTHIDAPARVWRGQHTDAVRVRLTEAP